MKNINSETHSKMKKLFLKASRTELFKHNLDDCQREGKCQALSRTLSIKVPFDLKILSFWQNTDNLKPNKNKTCSKVAHQLSKYKFFMVTKHINASPNNLTELVNV